MQNNFLKMKNALLIYPHNSNHIFNIGDYIQSTAAKQFLPEVDYFINREELNKNISHPTKVILNGWFMHFPENWPPSPKLYPLFIAFHLNKLAETGMLDELGIKYLKDHEPIGCRDWHTVRLLESKGIKAYFSGCLTLTLGQTYKRHKVENAKIILTDLNSNPNHSLKFKIETFLALIFKSRLLSKIKQRMASHGVEKSLVNVAAIYTTYKKVIDREVLLNATYIEHEIEDKFQTEEEKFQYADNLLRQYSEAEFVVTSRIHCALPCLGIGTPVVFIDNDFVGDVNNCRLDGIKDLFYTIKIGPDGTHLQLPGISKINNNTNFQNKKEYLKFSEHLRQTCQRFFMGI